MPSAPLTFQKASAPVHLCSSQTAHLSYLNPMGGKGKGIHRRLGKQKRSLTGNTSADWGSVERESVVLRVGKNSCGMIIKACHGVLVCHVQLYSTLDVRRRKPYTDRMVATKKSIVRRIGDNFIDRGQVLHVENLKLVQKMFVKDLAGI